MSRTVYYTDHFTDLISSVVSEVFYDSNRGELFVVLNSGVIAGYSGVSKTVFGNFHNAASRGSFWNHEVKNRYGTLNGDVNFAPFEPASEGTKTANFTVVVNVNGDLKFDLDASDVQSAVDKVKDLLDKSVVDGVFFVKEVKFNQ